jgi:hypothetical protein
LGSYPRILRRALRTAAAFLTERGFEAEVVLDAEPDLPIAFVVTKCFFRDGPEFPEARYSHAAPSTSGRMTPCWGLAVEYAE